MHLEDLYCGLSRSVDNSVSSMNRAGIGQAVYDAVRPNVGSLIAFTMQFAIKMILKPVEADALLSNLSLITAPNKTNDHLWARFGDIPGAPLLKRAASEHLMAGLAFQEVCATTGNRDGDNLVRQFGAHLFAEVFNATRKELMSVRLRLIATSPPDSAKHSHERPSLPNRASDEITDSLSEGCPRNSAIQLFSAPFRTKGRPEHWLVAKKAQLTSLLHDPITADEAVALSAVAHGDWTTRYLMEWLNRPSDSWDEYCTNQRRVAALAEQKAKAHLAEIRDPDWAKRTLSGGAKQCPTCNAPPQDLNWVWRQVKTGGGWSTRCETCGKDIDFFQILRITPKI